MRTNRITSIASALLISSFAGSAWAQEDGEADPCGGDAVSEEGGAEGGGEGEASMQEPVGEAADGAAMDGAPPLILPKGKLGVHVTLGVNLSTDAVAKPIAIAPDVWYGVMPKLEVGLVHSNYGLSGFWFQPGGGICVTGEENGCGKLYDGPVGLMANYLVSESASMDLAVNGGLIISSFDPLPLSLKIGVKGRYKTGKIMVHFNPAVSIGLTERDFNKEEIMVPVMVGFAVNEKLHAGLQTGIAGPLDGFGDAFYVPVGVGALYGLNDKMSVGGAFNFINLAGKNGGADFRTLDLMFMWHN